MKYAMFLLAALLLVPLATRVACTSARGRGWVLAGLVLSTAVYMQTSIHLVQIEAYRAPDHGFVLCITDLLALSLGLAVALCDGQRVAWLPYNSFWLAAFFATCCASSALAAEPELSVFTLFTLARAGFIYWCVTNCIRCDTPPRYAYVGFTALAVLVTARCAWQFVGEHIYRVSGFFVHSNTLPTFLLLLLPSLVLLGLCDTRIGRVGVAIIAAATLGCILVVVKTQSRGGMVATGLAMGATVGIALLLAPSRRVKFAAAIGMGLSTVGGLWLAASIADRFHNAPPASAMAREEYNAAALRMADGNLLGVGLNNYSWVLSQPDAAAAAYKQGWFVMSNDSVVGVAHNIYLLTAAEVGWPGLVLLVIVMARFLWMALLGAARSRTLEGLLELGLAIGMICCLALGSLEWVLRQTPVMDMYMITAGLATGLADRATRARATDPAAGERNATGPAGTAKKVQSSRRLAGGLRLPMKQGPPPRRSEPCLSNRVTSTADTVEGSEPPQRGARDAAEKAAPTP